MKPTLPFAQYDADIDHLHILHKAIPDGVTNLYTEDFVRQQQEKLKKYELRNAEQRKRIEELEAKTITDEEIEKTSEMMADMYNLAILKLKGSRGYSEQCSVMEEILRAILRKAQEK